MNPTALNEWLSSEIFNSRDCYATNEEWRRHKAEYEEKRRVCKEKILEALNMDPDIEHPNIKQVLSEIFILAYVKDLKTNIEDEWPD